MHICISCRSEITSEHFVENGVQYVRCQDCGSRMKVFHESDPNVVHDAAGFVKNRNSIMARVFDRIRSVITSS